MHRRPRISSLARGFALLIILLYPAVGYGDGFVIRLIDAVKKPAFFVAVTLKGALIPLLVVIDTGGEGPGNPGMIVNNNGNNATSIGVTGGTPGGEMTGTGGKPSIPANNASLPSTPEVTPPPTTLPTNKMKQPPLPDKVSTVDLGEVAKGAAPGLLTIDWLRDNFRDWGETDGKNGRFFFLTAKNESADDELETHKRAIDLANSGAPVNPGGHPPGTHNKPMQFQPARNTPSGILDVDGGYTIEINATNLANGSSASESFLIDTGFDHTAISEAFATQLGINLNSLPRETLSTGFAQVTVPATDLGLDVFPGTSFPTFDLPVGILSTELDPLSLNFLGTDVLNQFTYWEMSPSGDGLSGTFFAAVPEPPMSLTLGGFCVLLMAYGRLRRSSSGT